MSKKEKQRSWINKDGKKRFTFGSRPSRCGECKGEGSIFPKTGSEICPECGGIGV